MARALDSSQVAVIRRRSMRARARRTVITSSPVMVVGSSPRSTAATAFPPSVMRSTSSSGEGTRAGESRSKRATASPVSLPPLDACEESVQAGAVQLAAGLVHVLVPRDDLVALRSRVGRDLVTLDLG